MSLTTVTYKGSVSQRINMQWLSNVLMQAELQNSVENLTLDIGNEKINIGDLFSISGSFETPEIVLENANDKMDFIGHAITPGMKINVQGDCGHYAGANLAGGHLEISGNALNHLGSTMQAGEIVIHGNCNDYVGSALTGKKRGMSGGSILIHGNAGDFVGDLMRRGTIMIAGDIGNHCASRMIAGTITNLGTIGKHVGVGMRRGTLLFPHKPEDDLIGFDDCGRHSLGYLTLLVHELRRSESAFRSLHPMRRRVQKYAGDSSVGGLGELLVWIG